MLVALINNNTVVGVQDVTDDDFNNGIARRYDAIVDVSSMNPTPIVGWKFVGNQLVPGEGQSSTPSMLITKLALRQRFTFTELCALTTASTTDVRVSVLLANLQAATFIDLLRPDTTGGIMLLVSLGLITLERANTILTTTPSAVEIYKA